MEESIRKFKNVMKKLIMSDKFPRTFYKNLIIINNKKICWEIFREDLNKKVQKLKAYTQKSFWNRPLIISSKFRGLFYRCQYICHALPHLPDNPFPVATTLFF